MNLMMTLTRRQAPDCLPLHGLPLRKQSYPNNSRSCSDLQEGLAWLYRHLMGFTGFTFDEINTT